MKQFEMIDIIKSEIAQRRKRLQEVERKKRSALLEKQQAKNAYVQKVAEGAEQIEIDEAYKAYQEKAKEHERYSEEHEIMSSSDAGFSISGDEFSSKYSYEYVPMMREKHIQPIIGKLEKAKHEYLTHLLELDETLNELKKIQRDADNIMSRKEFRSGENRNIIIAIENVTSLSNEMIDKAIITNNEIDKYIGGHLL